MALREDPACQEVLSAMLELDVEKDRDYQLQMISTLQSTSSGKHKYAAYANAKSPFGNFSNAEDPGS